MARETRLLLLSLIRPASSLSLFSRPLWVSLVVLGVSGRHSPVPRGGHHLHFLTLGLQLNPIFFVLCRSFRLFGSVWRSFTCSFFSLPQSFYNIRLVINLSFAVWSIYWTSLTFFLFGFLFVVLLWFLPRGFLSALSFSVPVSVSASTLLGLCLCCFSGVFVY